MFFLGINCCATIKHRCVTHLYCCNTIQQSDLSNFVPGKSSFIPARMFRRTSAPVPIL